MQRFGIIDLGSNTIRLATYEVPKQRERVPRFNSLISTKKTAGLSSYVQDGALSQAGIDRAAEVLGDMLERARIIRCDRTGILATAVLRNCTNSKEVRKALERRTGARIDLLSGEEEARLDFVGATCDRDAKRGILIDIGGGSTELVSFAKGNPADMVSLPQGCVSSYARFVERVLPTREERAAIAESFQNLLDATPALRPCQKGMALGVGGSIRALGKLDGVLKGGEKASKSLRAADVDTLLFLLHDDPSTFAHALAKVAPDRMHTLGCALAMLKVIVDRFSIDTIDICKYGVREGYLIENMIHLDKD